MNTGPNMETFGARQARRFKERKGYDRESLWSYRPGPETIGKMGSDGKTRTREPFSAFKKRMKRWYLNLNANHRWRELAKNGSGPFVGMRREPIRS